MTARFIVGDTRAVTATLPDGSVDLIMSSPPYFKQRSYLSDGHPLKPLEIGNEPNPIGFVNMLLDLTADWRRILNPRTGSIVIELGDKYMGSGGAGGDYDEDGLREGQPKFRAVRDNGDGPRDKSACCTAELYRASLAYGWRPFSRDPSPAGRWQVRNTITRCSPNPPVGQLGKKWRPATTDLVVATPDDDRRYWDDVATRVVPGPPGGSANRNGNQKPYHGEGIESTDNRGYHLTTAHPAGAPLLDHWNLLQNRIDRALQLARSGADGYTQEDLFGVTVDKKGRQKETPGGKLIREAWANGEIDMGDFWPIVAGGYPGAHYAVYPPELCEPFIEAMSPRRVCLTCGEPSRREVDGDRTYDPDRQAPYDAALVKQGQRVGFGTRTTGWTTCGHPGTDRLQLDGFHTGTGWRPGIVLDPFAGTFTTGAVATGHGRDAIGIDLNPDNADLALERVGPLMLTIEHHDTTTAA